MDKGKFETLIKEIILILLSPILLIYLIVGVSLELLWKRYYFKDRLKKIFCKHNFSGTWFLSSIPNSNNSYKMGLSDKCLKCGKIKYSTSKEIWKEYKENWKKYKTYKIK